MSIWSVVKCKNSFKVTYKSHVTGLSHNCGDQHPDTSVRLVFDWAATQADPGDLLLYNGKVVAQKMQPAEA